MTVEIKTPSHKNHINASEAKANQVVMTISGKGATFWIGNSIGVSMATCKNVVQSQAELSKHLEKDIFVQVDCRSKNPSRTLNSYIKRVNNIGEAFGLSVVSVEQLYRQGYEFGGQFALILG